MFGTAKGVSKEAFKEWRACSRQFLSEEFGQDNIFFQDFANKVNKATLVACNIGIGILLAVKRAEAPPAPATEEEKEPVKEAAPPEQPPVVAKKTSKRGWSVAATQKAGAKLKKKKPARPVIKEEKAKTHEKEIKLQPEEPPVTATEAVHEEKGAAAIISALPSPKLPEVSMSTVEALENLLWQAQVQLSQGHEDAAAVLCGGVSEVALRYLSTVHNIPVKEWDTMGNLNDKLLDNGVYGNSTHKKFVSWWYLREDALAANYDAYNKNDVASTLRGVEGFLKQHLS